MTNQAGIEDHNGDKAEALAEGYKKTDRRKGNPELYQQLDEAAKAETALRVLDIGSGAGNDAIEIAKVGHKVVGIEPSDLRRIAIRDHAHPNIEYRDDLLPSLPSLDGEKPFDVINLSAVLQYIDPEERVSSLKRIAELMSPNAKLFISYPSPPSREHQYELSPKMLQADIDAANAELPEYRKLIMSAEPNITPDSRGRKSLDGRELNFYSFVIENGKKLQEPWISKTSPDGACWSR